MHGTDLLQLGHYLGRLSFELDDPACVQIQIEPWIGLQVVGETKLAIL